MRVSSLPGRAGARGRGRGPRSARASSGARVWLAASRSPGSADPWGLPRADRGAVAVQDLGLVRVPGGGGAVGVQDQGPAPPVDHDLVVEEAQEHAVFDAGLAAVSLVLDVVDLAGAGGLVVPPGPLAVLVAQDDRVADARGDRLGVPDVQRQAGAGQPGAELPAPQERRQPARTRDQVHRLADDRLLEGLPRQRGVRGGHILAAVAVAVAAVAAVAAGAAVPGAAVARAVVPEPVQLD